MVTKIALDLVDNDCNTFVDWGDGPGRVEVLYFVKSLTTENFPNNWVLVGRMWPSNVIVKFFDELY